MARLVLVVLAIVVVVGCGSGIGEPSCDVVSVYIAPCIPYLSDKGELGPDCCRGLELLENSATTTADRQAVCKCLQQEASRTPDLDFARAEELPKRCGIDPGVPITPSVNCSM